MQENLVRENVENSFVLIQHIGGKQNLADLFTKEMKDKMHFIELRNLMMRSRNISWFMVMSCKSSIALLSFHLRGVLVCFQILRRSF
jgi:hypothetical protein